MAKKYNYNAKMADLILSELMQGKTLSAIIREHKHLPPIDKVFGWFADAEFRSRYDRAREIGYEVMADHILDITDNFQIQEIHSENSDGTSATITRDHIDHRRLQVDARKWLLAKSLPKFANKQNDTELRISVVNDLE